MVVSYILIFLFYWIEASFTLMFAKYWIVYDSTACVWYKRTDRVNLL